ncbi:MAG: hypothetical protein AB7V26_12870 [Lysobacterales bacterium]
MMDKERIRRAALGLEAAFLDHAHVPLIKALDTEYLQELIRLAKNGGIDCEYTGPLPWSYGFLEGWFEPYPAVVAAFLEFDDAVTHTKEGLIRISEIDEMIRGFRRE